MARQKSFALSVEDKSTTSIFESNYANYGSLTLEDRALPDFRDGLLKVHRRTLWAMHHIAKANGSAVKTARVVGEVIGKYHPHGDLPVQSAIESMVWSANSLIDGQGNWGGQFDSAAPMRYTNCRLSQYSSSVLFHPDYMPTAVLHPNYDGKDEEPELLPALLPNVILNGVFGIAVGLQVSMPSFEQAGVVTLVKGMLKGKTLTTAICRKLLVPTFSFGGNAPILGDNIAAFDLLMTEGRASLFVYCDYEIDHKAKTLRITAIPPKKPMDTLLDNLRATEHFSSVQDVMGKQTKTPSDVLCTFKKTVNIDKVIEEIEEACLWSKVPFNVAVVERKWNPTENRIRSDIHQWGVIKLLEKWLEWRLTLEKKMLTMRIATRKSEIERKNLLLLAQKNRAIVAQSWEAPDQKAFISTKLKVDADGAAYICDLRLSQLAKLSRDKLMKEIADLQALIKADQASQKDVATSVLSGLNLAFP